MSRPSAPVSPVPPTEDPPPQRSATIPRAPAVSDPVLSSYVYPADDDTSSLATSQRARRAMRVADETRAELRTNLGHPTRTLDDGTKEDATGVWRILEPLQEMALDWKTSKGRRAGIRGFFARQGSTLFSDFLKILIVALLVWLGFGKYLGH